MLLHSVWISYSRLSHAVAVNHRIATQVTHKPMPFLKVSTPNDVDILFQEVLKMYTLSHPNVMVPTGVRLDAVRP